VAGNRKGSHDIASTVRGAFLRACKSLEEDNRPLSTILEEMLREKPADALNAVAKFVPKEMLIETTVLAQLEDLSDEAIAHEIGRLTRESASILASLGASQQTEH